MQPINLTNRSKTPPRAVERQTGAFKEGVASLAISAGLSFSYYKDGVK